jgi:PAS domain S-box-containing protein
VGDADDKLRRTEEALRLIVQSVRDYAIFLIDPEGRVQTWNDGAQRIKQWRRDEIVGQPIDLFYTDEDRKAGKPQHLLREAERLGAVEDEGWRVRKDGSRFWADAVMTALRDSEGQLVGFTKVTRDLTERKRAEEERLRLALTEEALRLRDQFLSIASHELRTPLSAMQLQLESLSARLRKLDGALADRVDRAIRSGDRLTQLVETLLDVSRISSGSFRLAPTRFDLADAIRDVVDRFREPAVRAGSSLSATVPAHVEGCWDRLRVEQIATNLVANALKYAAGSPVEVELRPDTTHVTLEVRDRGPGIPEEAIGRIFERFERAASEKNYGGLGLGLYVTREIARAHGGTVDAENRQGGGARFMVRLPLEPTCPPPEST